ncbi:hypothetical protein ACFE04_005984 [Oxalis oulophora]
MEHGGGRKRSMYDASVNGNGGFKKSRRQEMENFSTGIGGISKPCTKFFSTSGCPFGESCHFSHYVPGGYKPVPQFHQQAPRNAPAPPSFPDSSSPPSMKTRLCHRFNSPEGCNFGDKCRYAHGDWDIGRPNGPSFDGPRSRGPMPGRMGGPPQGHAATGSFGASATAKISVDGSLAGAIIGKNGVNSKQICRVTGAKLAIRDHESDPNLRNIELEGTFDQIKQASGMVRELIMNVSNSGSGHHMKNQGFSGGPPGAGSNLKTKLCERFAKGSCTFGERCNFAHGPEELRK